MPAARRQHSARCIPPSLLRHCLQPPASTPARFKPNHPCRDATPPADAPASRFSFRGSLAPLVMVTGRGGVVPWCCPIDGFTGEEAVPQVTDCFIHSSIWQLAGTCWRSQGQGSGAAPSTASPGRRRYRRYRPGWQAAEGSSTQFVRHADDRTAWLNAGAQGQGRRHCEGSSAAAHRVPLVRP